MKKTVDTVGPLEDEHRAALLALINRAQTPGFDHDREFHAAEEIAVASRHGGYIHAITHLHHIIDGVNRGEIDSRAVDAPLLTSWNPARARIERWVWAMYVIKCATGARDEA